MKKTFIALALSAATLYAPMASAQAVPAAAATGSMPTALAGTGLTVGAAAGIVAAVVVAVVVISDSSTTTP
jgi:hypothetical protein